MSNYAIEVENLCISYKGLKSYSIKRNFFKKKEKKKELFEAVKNLSFKVEEGEILGIIGKNGSGKSTTLRAIAGIFSPNSGKIDLHGHSISLLSIGVGFQKELTGRENILLSGMLLGFTEEEIREREDEIIEFSELGDFIDAPVKTYSSGMYSKLAFSITAILETDIMLIDEVLSVGDMRFKKKSYEKMKQLISAKDRTVVIVSHDMNTVQNLCTKVLWINDGQLVKYGDAAEILPEYREFMNIPYVGKPAPKNPNQQKKPLLGKKPGAKGPAQKPGAKPGQKPGANAAKPGLNKPAANNGKPAAKAQAAANPAPAAEAPKAEATAENKAE